MSSNSLDPGGSRLSGVPDASSRASASTSETAEGKGKGKDIAKGKGKEAGKDTKVPRIMPHESLGDYNRRVEGLLRPGVANAIKSASLAAAQVRQNRSDLSAEERSKGKRSSGEHNEEDSDDGVLKPNRPLRLFKEKEGPRRLNDIVQAPPDIRKRKRTDQQTGVWQALGSKRNPLNAGQQRLLEVERERVIEKYREMKAVREAERSKIKTST
jgi:hypothetical protein